MEEKKGNIVLVIILAILMIIAIVIVFVLIYSIIWSCMRRINDRNIIETIKNENL